MAAPQWAIDWLVENVGVSEEVAERLVDDEGVLDVQEYERAVGDGPNVLAVSSGLREAGVAAVREEDEIPNVLEASGDPAVQRERDRTLDQRERDRIAEAAEEREEQTLESLRLQATDALSSGDTSQAQGILAEIQALEGGAVPPLLAEILAQYGIDPLQTPDIQADLIASYETFFPGEAISDEDVFDRFAELPANQMLQVVTEAVGPAAEQSVTYTVGPRSEPVTVMGRHQQAIERAFPEVARHMSTLVRASHIAGVDPAMLAFAASSHNLFRPGLDDAPSAFEGPDAASLGGGEPQEARRGLFGTLQRGLRETLDESREIAGFESPDRRVVQSRRFGSLFDLGESLEAGRRRYDDWTMALIHSHDERLAAQLFDDPYSLNGDQREDIRQILVDFDPNALAAAGFGRVDLEKFGFIQSLTPDGGASAQSVTLPDQGALDESMRTLYRSWFQRDPAPDELQRFRGQVNGQVRAQFTSQQVNPLKGERPGAPGESETINLSTAPAEFARQTDEFSLLFGNKPSGLTEEQFVGQFRNSAQALTGSEAVDPSNIRAGMISGDIQTTVGRTFADQLNEQNNSTFMGRLARAAQTVQRST